MERSSIISVAIDANPISNGLYDILLEEQIIKILANNSSAITKEELQEQLSLQKIRVSKDEIIHAIKRLQQKKSIPDICKGTNIYLTTKCRNEIKIKAQKYQDTVNRIVKRYFISGIDATPDVVMKWLQQILSAIFHQYYVVVLSHLVNQNQLTVEQLEIDILHNQLITEYKIENKDSIILLSQLKEMLSCNSDPDVNYISYYYLNTCYAAQILTSKTYSHLSVAEIFKNKTIVLDTNILIALQLEKINPVHVNLEVIDDICKRLNIRLMCLPQTITEYQNVLKYKRELYKDIITEISPNVLSRAKYDNILHALRANGCYTAESVEHMFDTNLINPPVSLGDKLTAIEIFSKEESYTIFEHYKKNEQNKENLRKIFSPSFIDEYDQDDEYDVNEKCCIKKREGVVEHDLGLIGFVRTARGFGDWANKYAKINNDDVILLTMDSSLVTYVRNQYNQENFVYNIRDLITMLSLDRGGLLEKPEDFTPMLSSFVNNNFIIWEDTFNINDLSLMLKLEREVSSLQDEKVLQLSRELHKMRKHNSSKLDIHRFLQGELNYEYDKIHKEKNFLIESSNMQDKKIKEQEILLQQKELEIIDLKNQERVRRKKEFDKYYDVEYKSRNRWKFVLQSVYVLGILIVLVSIFLFIVQFFNRNEHLMSYLKELNYNWILEVINNFDHISSAMIFKVISGIGTLMTILGIFEYKRREKNRYYDKEIITKDILNKMKVNNDLDDYIANGIL